MKKLHKLETTLRSLNLANDNSSFSDREVDIKWEIQPCA